MAERKIIAVVGATGAQGGGLARAILADPGGGFAVRALTRDPSSGPARELAQGGAEVVRADVDDPASLVEAFRGAHGAFCVTFFWAHMSGERERAEARALAEAARDARIRHAIWSTLEDTRRWVPLSDPRMPTLQEKYKVPHFDAKGESDRLFEEAGVPTTYLATSFYWENFIHFGLGPKRGADGKLAFTLPMGTARLPGIAADDIGRCAYGIFRRGAELTGKRIAIAGEHLSGSEMAAAMTRALGEEVRYQDVPPDVYRGFGFPGADELGNMFQFKRDFEQAYRAPRDVNAARALNPSLQTFDAWLARNKGRIPLG
jgi:uncharacterized protein YbjT (DUF2867 family)